MGSLLSFGQAYPGKIMNAHQHCPRPDAVTLRAPVWSKSTESLDRINGGVSFPNTNVKAQRLITFSLLFFRMSEPSYQHQNLKGTMTNCTISEHHHASTSVT